MPGTVFDVELRPTAGAVRLVRSTAAALACVTTAATGHLSAGGTMDGFAATATFAGATLIAWLLAGRRVTTAQSVGLLLLCQVAVHLTGSTADMQMTAGMLVTHVGATAVSAVLLARGEAFAWRLFDLLGLRAVAQPLVPVAVPAWAPPRAAAATCPLHGVRRAYSRVERGPPSGS